MDATLQKAPAAGLTRRILENSVALFTSQLLSKIFRILANFLLARFLGPEDFGKWALVISFVELFRFLPDFGLDRTMVRRMAREEKISGLSANLFLRALFSALAVVAAGTALVFTGYAGNLKLLIYFYSLSFFLQACGSSFAAYFQAQLRSISLVWAYTAAGLLYLGLVLAGIFGGLGLTFFVGSLLGTEGLLLALFAFTFFRKEGKLAPFSFSDLGPAVKEAFPIALWLALGTVYFRVDTLIVYHYAGESATGLYSACFRLSETFLMLATAVSASLFPVFSRLKTENKEELAALFERSFFWFLTPALLLATLVLDLSPALINFLYGEAYLPAAPGLAVIIWSVVFMFANTLSTQAILACDREVTITKITAANVAVNLALNFWLVPRFGFIGACWATLGTEAANFVLQSLVLQKTIAPGILRRVLPYAVAPALSLVWYGLYPESFRSAGVWLFTFGYLVFLLNRKGRGQR